jgi:hypothetical protein
LLQCIQSFDQFSEARIFSGTDGVLPVRNLAGSYDVSTVT